MRYLLTLAVVSLLPGTLLAQSTWHVDVTAVPPGNGSAGSPFTSIQYAIEQPSTLPGDTLLVRPGAYVEALDFIGKDITLRSTAGPVATIVSPTVPPASTQPALTFVSGEGPGAVFEGFTLVGGHPPGGRGGVVTCIGASPRIVDCVVRDDSSFEGALWVQDSELELKDCTFAENQVTALFVDDSDITVEGCTFVENETVPGASGAQIDASSASFVDCDFISNEGTYGSALLLTGSDVEISGCRFDANHGSSAILVQGGVLEVETTEFIDNRSDYDSAGAAFLTSCTASFTDCTFLHNRAGADDYRGGALYAYNSDTTVTDSVFLDNFAARGGAAYTEEGGSARYERCWFESNRAVQVFCCGGGSGGAIGTNTVADVIAERCVFVRNRADGPNYDPGYHEGWGGAVIGDVDLSYCTLVANHADDVGGAAYGATLAGCIVVGNDPAPLAGGASATYSNVEGGAPGTGNIDVPADFIDAPNDNFHLAPGSACIDAGDPTSPRDLDGSRADMGAFQFADCNGNGLLDADDISNGTSPDLNLNGFPDECECLLSTYCETSAHSAGPGARISFGGSASVSRNDLVLIAGACPPNRPGLFFYGTGRGAAPFGDGVRCVFGQIYRLGLVHASQQGVAARPLDLTNPPQAAGLIGAGSRWYFQFWFRDPGGPGGSGFNLSDGLEVVFCP